MVVLGRVGGGIPSIVVLQIIGNIMQAVNYFLGANHLISRLTSKEFVANSLM